MSIGQNLLGYFGSCLILFYRLSLLPVAFHKHKAVAHTPCTASSFSGCLRLSHLVHHLRQLEFHIVLFPTCVLSIPLCPLPTALLLSPVLLLLDPVSTLVRSTLSSLIHFILTTTMWASHSKHCTRSLFRSIILIFHVTWLAIYILLFMTFTIP